ncbi:MAG: hypothetical protein WB919_23895, partial [Candidatus Sulfotelmatobacter sp.]
DLQRLCEREEEKIAANPKYRTSPRTLKRLAEAHMFFDVPAANRFVSGHALRRAEPVTKSSTASAAAAPGPWDTFSVRTLALTINRRMAREFNADSQKIRQASTTAVTRSLNLDLSRWTPLQKQSLENWSLVLAQIPNLARWTPQDKQAMVKIISAKSGPDEMSYLRQTQHHTRLRAELLRLGSSA